MMICSIINIQLDLYMMWVKYGILACTKPSIYFLHLIKNSCLKFCKPGDFLIFITWHFYQYNNTKVGINGNVSKIFCIKLWLFSLRWHLNIFPCVQKTQKKKLNDITWSLEFCLGKLFKPGYLFKNSQVR